MANNPLRVIFLKLAAIPPAVLLLVIIGMAVVVTMMVTGKVSEEETKHWQSYNPDSPRALVVFSCDTIPSHTEIQASMIGREPVYKNEIWQDAIKSEQQVVGRRTRSMIPAHTQIREADLR